MSLPVRSSLFLLSVVLLLSPVASQAQGVPVVRVALSLNASHVSLSSSHILHLSSPEIKWFHLSKSVSIHAAEDGLLINKQKIQTTTVIIENQDRHLFKLLIDGGITGTPSQEWIVTGNLVFTLQGGALFVVNAVNLESYVAGVVSSEMNPEWHKEVLKGQAVVVRTYVLHKQQGQALFDVVASVQDQVYTGVKHVTASVQQAVHATRGEVLTYEGRPILAAYSSTTAGPTENASNVWSQDLPYLKGVDCPFDRASPRYHWSTAIPFKSFEQSLRDEGLTIGVMSTLAPYTLTRAGRVKTVRILHSKGELIVRGQDLRRILGYSEIRSTQFHIENIGRNVVFTGKGAGHAVGLCQWGAKELAELGYRYQSILQYYYPGTDLLPYNRVVLNPPPPVQHFETLKMNPFEHSHRFSE